MSQYDPDLERTHDPKARGRSRQETKEKQEAKTLNLGAYKFYSKEWHGLKEILRKEANPSGFENPDYTFSNGGGILVSAPNAKDFQATGKNLFKLAKRHKLNLSKFVANLEVESSSSEEEESSSSDEEVVVPFEKKDIDPAIASTIGMAKGGLGAFEGFLDRLVATCQDSTLRAVVKQRLIHYRDGHFFDDGNPRKRFAATLKRLSKDLGVDDFLA